MNDAPIGGRYRIGQRLGHGGMGEVYRAEDVTTGQIVALKRLEGERPGDALKFRREFQTLAQLKHPRIIEVYDYGIEGNRPYYTMELLDGDDFRDLAPLPWKDACRLLRDVASALALLHSRRLVHRDLSPRNLRCTTDGRAKLLDFGVLTTMGLVTDVAGAPPCVAPETLLGAPLDQRADLFGLGATAYWLLTGRHARAVRRLEDILDYRQPAIPPSAHIDDIPQALDDLILSLLSENPLGRPRTAGAVMEQLALIGGLERAPELEVARGYVLSGSLVGRQREMEVVRRRIARAVEGKGRTVMLRGRSGSGKSRLLDEIVVEAKLAGALVVRTGGGDGGPYALLHALGTELARVAPDFTIDAARPHSAALWSSLPELAAALGLEEKRASRRRALDARETRLELQRILADWVLAVAARRPLVLVVDNLQRADEASATVLASLGHAAREHPLLLVVALRSDERPRAPAILDRIRDRALVLRIRSLKEDDIERLMQGMFGDVPNIGRLARWMRRASAGSPLHCVELARHLVDTAVLRYDEGTWIIPDGVEQTPLPGTLRASMDARVRALAGPARELGQVLAVHGQGTSLDLCVALSERPADEVFAALDELMREEVLSGTVDEYRFRHDALREAMLRGLDAEARRRCELRVGEVLLGSGSPTLEQEARIGWHLLRGGEADRGAELLASAGRRLFEATSFDDAIPVLEAALGVLETRDTPLLRLTELRLMLASAGFYSNRHVALRYADPALRALRRYCGVERIHRYLRFLPARAAVLLGLVVTVALFWLTSRRRRDPRPVVALRMYLQCLTYTAGVAAFSFDTRRLGDCHAEVVPLTTLRHPALQASPRFIGNLLNYNLGRLRTLRQISDDAFLEMQERDIRAGDLATRDQDLRVAIGGIRFQRGMAAIRSGGSEAFAEIEHLENLGLRMWALGAIQLRMLRHMWRGEEEDAKRVWAEAEMDFMRSGSLWQIDATNTSSLALTYACLGDMLGLKRTIDALERLVQAGFRYDVHLIAARGESHRLRGKHDEAEACLRDALGRLPEGEGLLRPWVLAALADAILAAGRVDEAVAAAESALRHAEHPEYGQVPYRFRAARTLALAESARGEHDEAAGRLERLLEEAELYGNPFISGSLHEARALVALAAGDQPGFELNRLRTETLFRATRNPVLVARAERLERTGPAPAMRSQHQLAEDVATVIGGDPPSRSILSQAFTPRVRAAKALEWLLASSGARSGYLYLKTSRGLELVAPVSGDEPAAGMRHVLEQAVSAPGPEAPAGRAELGPVRDGPAGPWRPLVLRLDPAGRSAVVGAVALLEGDAPLAAPSAAVAAAVAEALDQAGDVDTETPSTLTAEVGRARSGF